MLSKESQYLTIGCLVFGCLAVPTMLGLVIHDMLRSNAANSDPEAHSLDTRSVNTYRAPPAPPPEVYAPVAVHRGDRPLQQDLQLFLDTPVEDQLNANHEPQNTIEVEVVNQRLSQGVELQLRVTNRTSQSLNLLNFELDFFGEHQEHLGIGATSCFHLGPGESKVVSAVNYEAFAQRVRDYDLRLGNALGVDDEPVRGLRLKVTSVNLLRSS
jgi:hypothetical protein